MKHLFFFALFVAACALCAAGPQIPELNWEPRSDWVNVTDDKLHSLPNVVPDGGLQAVAAALDDFRQLYDLDLRVNRGMK